MIERPFIPVPHRRVLDTLFGAMLGRAEEAIDLMAAPDRNDQLARLAQLGQELAQLSAAAALIAGTND